ncbi:hypothetical protein GH714_028359 [Hevea brasiliensis]|uniref:DWNN domain-containing protein n=1 Tax=Hevea brasiliensis TaxID=3981 RepID=A0A6A6LV95_HEVBR|nr:hypothetical protein GH714_028359 [Hevea brasiliensis]
MKSHSNGLCFGTDFDLVVINAQTNDCYVDDMLIPNNTRVLIRRIPGTRRGKPVDTATIVVIESNSHLVPLIALVHPILKLLLLLHPEAPPGDASFGYDNGFGDDVFVIPRMKPAQSSMTSVDVESDEDSKIKALVNTPALDGSLKYCPTNGDPNYDFKRVRPPTGIPKSMLVPNPDGSYVLSSGATAVLQPNDDAFKKEIFGCFPSKRSWSVSDLHQNSLPLVQAKDEANKRKLLDDPYQIAKKARTTRAADVSEATIGSTRMKDTSVLVVEEEVQEEVVSREGGKNRKVAEDEAGMEGYVAPYYAAGAMNYGLSPFGTTFNGMMNQASFSMQQMCGRQ